MWLFVLKAYWKPLSLIGALLLILGTGYCAGMRHVQAGDAAHAIRAGQDTVHAHAVPLAKASFRLVTDTVRVRTLITAVRRDTAWVHDTVYVPGDTTARLAVPVTQIDTLRALVATCSDLSSSCSAYHREAEATITGLRLEVAARVPVSCTGPSMRAGLGTAAIAALVVALWKH